MGLPELRRTAQVVYGANEPSPFRLVFISQTLTENPQNMSPHWREGMFCGFCCGMDMDSLLKCFVLIGFTQPLEKLLFGGESPLTMRYGLRVDNPHPLGPSTGTA